MSEQRITAPGPGWRPPGKVKSGNFRDSTGALLNSIGDAVARANHMDFGREGIHTQHGFYATNPDPPQQSSAVTVAQMQDALFPGTHDLPGTGKAKIMTVSSGNRLSATSEVVSVVNYSTSIYAPIGGIVGLMPFNGAYMAIWSSG